ncbi:hypothetical protein GCM10025857_56310 [Alicyclobacillus contaminans]|nr:hypothetical protein GCM10025857_56310 [Alicyclobacillus contaminans]
MESRKTVMDASEFEEILELIEADKRQNELWEDYCKQHLYAQGIAFEEVLNAIYELLNKINYGKGR